MNEYAKKQEEFCEKNGYPKFAPRDGVCYSCNKNIYDDEATAKFADSHLITGCPFCSKSYCD